MLYREIIAVCSEIHTKHINTPCGQNVELLNVKLAVRKVHCVLEWLIIHCKLIAIKFPLVISLFVISSDAENF